LKPEKLRELADDIGHDFGFVNGNKLFLLLLRHRLGRNDIRLWLEERNEWPKKATNFIHNAFDFIVRFSDFNKGFLGLLVKLAPFLDSSNASIGGKEDADRINFLLRQATGASTGGV
jgi:hypothetical protein